jgi:hypothetical protein
MNEILADRELLNLIQQCEEARRELEAAKHGLDTALHDLDAAREQLDTAREEVADATEKVLPALDAVADYHPELREREHIKTDGGDNHPQVPHHRKRSSRSKAEHPR